jgi:hypothetical protein
MHDVTEKQQDFINRQFFNLTLFTLIFGVMFYDSINVLGFTYVDEICAALLLLLFGYRVFVSVNWEFDKFFLIVIGVFVFYLIYSLAIGSNTTGAILMDFVIQFKPYIGFFCVYAIRPTLSPNQRKIIRQVIFLSCIYTFVVGATWLIPGISVIEYTFTHPSRLATAASVLALLYLYCSDYTTRDKLIFILILAIGILSWRSKHFGFFVIAAACVFYFKPSFSLKFNLKNTLFFVAILALALFVAREKIYFYFVTGGFGSGRTTTDLYARIALYYFSLQLFVDYFPFGTGFATYATFASGAHYSPIYVKYGMERMHGLTKEMPDFIADTYFPALAQFGVVGVVLFFGFWIYLVRRAAKAYKYCCKESLMAILIIIFFMIESVADATLTHNRGLFMMILLGLLFFDMRTKTASALQTKNQE